MPVTIREADVRRPSLSGRAPADTASPDTAWFLAAAQATGHLDRADPPLSRAQGAEKWAVQSSALYRWAIRLDGAQENDCEVA